MAQVPITNGPTVPESGAPTPGLSIQPPAEAFGTNVLGTGLQQTGEAVQKASDTLSQYALQYQAINNKTQADAAGMTTATRLAAATEDYRANNQGLAMSENLGTLYKKLDDIRQQGAGGLSPLAAIDYQQYTRNEQERLQNTMVGIAADARKTAIVGTSNAKIADAATTAVNSYDSDPSAFQAAMFGIHQEIAFQASPAVSGLTPAEQDLAERKVTGAIFQSVIEQKMAGGDYIGAGNVFSAHKSDMTPEQADQISQKLKQGTSSFVVDSAISDALNGNVPRDLSGEVGVTANAPYLTGGNAAFVAGISGPESGGRSLNAQGTLLTNPHSTAGGKDQFENGTWLTVLKGSPEFAGVIAGKTDQQILALRTNPALEDRATIAYVRMNAPQLQAAGYTPDAPNLRLAHGFGAADAIRILNTDKTNPGEPLAALLPEAAKSNPQWAKQGVTVGGLLAGYRKQFGGVTVDLSQGAPLEAGTQQAGVPTFSEAPPQFHTGDNVQEYDAKVGDWVQRYGMATWGPNGAHPNPVLLDKWNTSAMAQFTARTRLYAADQDSALAYLSNDITGGINGRAPTSLTDLTSMDPKAQGYLDKLSDVGRSTITRDLNLANAGYGAYHTPQMDANAQQQMALSYTNPDLFADPVHNNLQNMNLSQSDRLRLMNMQRTIGNSQQEKQARNVKLQSLLGDPIVAAQVRAIAPLPDDRTPGSDKYNAYSSYLGALLGKVEEAESQNGGKPLTAQQTEAIAQHLALVTGHTGGFLGFGATPVYAYQVPQASEARIRAQANSLQPGAGDQLTPNQVSEIYFQSGGR